MALYFEWDEKKSINNIKKHEISFEEATTVFGDPLSKTIIDPLHTSDEEVKYITIGMSYRQKLLVVVHCDREGKIRIISARKVTRREKIEYEKN